MKYVELLKQAEDTITGLGIRAYCQDVCKGQCCEHKSFRGKEYSYSCKKYETCGVEHCRTRLACSAFVCGRLLRLFKVIAPVTAQVFTVTEERVRHRLEHWLDERSEKTGAEWRRRHHEDKKSADDFLAFMKESKEEKDRPSAFFSDYTLEEVADLHIPTSYPSLDPAEAVSLPLTEVERIRATLARYCADKKEIGYNDFALVEMLRASNDHHHLRTYIGSNGKKYMIVNFIEHPEYFAFFGPVERDYPFTTTHHMPRCHDRAVRCESWDEAEKSMVGHAHL